MEEFDTFAGQILIFCQKILFSETLQSFLHQKLTNIRTKILNLFCCALICYFDEMLPELLFNIIQVRLWRLRFS